MGSVGYVPKYIGRTCSVNTLPVSSVSSVRTYRTFRYGWVRIRHFGKFGTTSIPVRTLPSTPLIFVLRYLLGVTLYAIMGMYV